MKNKNSAAILEGFRRFDLFKDLNEANKFIIKEWTRSSFQSDLQKWLYNLDMENFEIVSYFTSRFMYSLNFYAYQENCFCIENNKKLYLGHKRSFTNLMLYKKAIGKIIVLPNFFSTSEDKLIGEHFSGRRNSKWQYKTNFLFSTIFILENHYQKNFISNGINIQKLSIYFKEKEILFQPFSFYFLKDIIIDFNNYTADIYLETIGKEEILEKQIKYGKEIEYNEKKKIKQVKKQ